MFYWSYENFKMVEEEFEARIRHCASFHPFSEAELEHGVFCLENGKNYYVMEGMTGFHVFETPEYLKEEDTLFIMKEDGSLALVDKRTAGPIAINYVMQLPLSWYDDVIPDAVHEAEDKLGGDHCIVVGYEPDDTEDMVCVQEYNGGYRTVWISQKTLDNPVRIEEGWYSLGLPDDLESLCREIEDMKEEIVEAVRKEPKTFATVYGVFIDFVYEDRYYRMLPTAFDLHREIFFGVLNGIERRLIEMGCPYVKQNYDMRWD